MSYQDDYCNKRNKKWRAAGELEIARLSISREVLNTPKPRRFYRTTTFSVVLTAFLSIATISSAYFAYQKFPVVRETVQSFFNSFKQDYSKSSAQALVSRGNALRVKGLYKEAEFAYQAAIEKFAVKENKPGLGNVYTELGILHTRTKNYGVAEKQFQKALSYFAGDSDGLGYASINLAQLHLFQWHFKSAEKYFLEANQHYMTSGNGNGLGNVALGLGNLHMAAEDPEKAFQYFGNAETVFNLAKNKRGLINTYNSLSRALRLLKSKEAKEMADKINQQSKSIELDTHTRDLPPFSLQESIAWLTSAFNQNRDVYESELNSKAKQETERALR